MDGISSETLSQSEYARLKGVTPQAVNQQLERRLKNYVIETVTCKGKVEKRISISALSDSELKLYQKSQGIEDKSLDIYNENELKELKVSIENDIKIFTNDFKDGLQKIEEVQTQNVQLLRLMESMTKELSLLRAEVQQLRQEQSSSTAVQAESVLLAAPAAHETANQAHDTPNQSEPEIKQTTAAPDASAPMTGNVSTETEPKSISGFFRWISKIIR